MTTSRIVGYVLPPDPTARQVQEAGGGLVGWWLAYGLTEQAAQPVLEWWEVMEPLIGQFNRRQLDEAADMLVTGSRDALAWWDAQPPRAKSPTAPPVIVRGPRPGASRGRTIAAVAVGAFPLVWLALKRLRK